jgi:hypothetical protein
MALNFYAVKIYPEQSLDCEGALRNINYFNLNYRILQAAFLQQRPNKSIYPNINPDSCLVFDFVFLSALNFLPQLD